MLKVDLHLHTAEDPHDRIQHTAYDLVARAAELGFDALAITLHDRQLGDARLADFARELGITLIPGVERTIGGKHVLLLNFPPEADRVRGFDDVARLKARSSGLVIAPHPFFPAANCLRRRLDEHGSLFDGVEYSYFHTVWANFNRAAVRWAEAHGKPIVGNSDLHDLRQLGRTFSLVDAAGDAAPDAICQAIRDGKVTVQTSPVPLPELTLVFGGMTIAPWLPQRRTAPAPAADLAA
jgi:predicted metal-dependent phosphoesterase TrpH